MYRYKYKKHMQAIHLLIGNFSGKKTKERFETILEPLQAILQIACLAYYPIGSKVSIHNNILFIQNAGYTQNVKRWYNNDKKEDLFYLYNVFSRFSKFYKNVLDPASAGAASSASSGSSNNGLDANTIHINSKLFSILHELAKTGINNLIRTYNQTDKIHILHTLQMYKGMLDSPELVRRLSNGSGDQHSGGSRNSGNNGTKLIKMTNLAEHDTAHREDNEDQELPRQFKKPIVHNDNGIPYDNLMEQSTSNIDFIFIKITDLYTQDDFDIIYHTLMKIENDPQYYLNYVDGLNKILEPVNIRIKKWIDDNIIF
jgi:hypothetical protein